MPSSKQTKTTKNNVSSLLNTNVLVVKFKTAYWSNKTVCVWTIIHFCWFFWESFTKTCNNLTLLKPQTYAGVTAVNVTPELKYWERIFCHMIQYHYSKTGMRQEGGRVTQELGMKNPVSKWRLLFPCQPKKSVYNILVVKKQKNYTSLYLHENETSDTLCNMFKNSVNRQRTKSVKLIARIERKLMNNACHGCQKRSQKYFPKL